MSYRDANNLTQRTGYPSRSGRPSHLDVPMADEYPSYGGSEDDYAKGEKGAKKGGRKGGPRKGEGNAVIKAITEASFYTKATYVWLVVSLLLCYAGYRSIRSNHGSVWLDCTTQGCDLTISPPPNKRGQTKTKVKFHRDQIVRSDVVRTDVDGNVRSTEAVGSTTSSWADSGRGGGGSKKGKYGKYGKYAAGGYNGQLGPDENGLYESYVLILKEREPTAFAGNGGASSTDPDAERTTTGERNLAPLFAHVEPNESTGEYKVDMRMFNRGQTRRSASTMATRINAYTRNRRHKLVLRENRNVPWQGVVMIVVGILSAVLSLLLGQLWEEDEIKPAVRQPVRRRPQSAQTGYGSYGGYKPQASSQRRGVSSAARGGGGAGSSAARPRAGGSSGTYGGYRPQQQSRR